MVTIHACLRKLFEGIILALSVHIPLASQITIWFEYQSGLSEFKGGLSTISDFKFLLNVRLQIFKLPFGGFVTKTDTGKMLNRIECLLNDNVSCGFDPEQKSQRLHFKGMKFIEQ